MKRFFIERRNEWQNGVWIDWNLIQIGGEYDKQEPCLYFRFAIFGFGLEIAFLCPWETKQSRALKELLDGRMPVLTISDVEEIVGVRNEKEKAPVSNLNASE